MSESNQEMEHKNQIICILEEDSNGENHKIHVQATWKDSHHFLDMLHAIIEHWNKNLHPVK